MEYRACQNCGKQASRVVWPWWKELLFREQVSNLQETVKNFQLFRCPKCGYEFSDKGLKIFGVFPPHLYWVPYLGLFFIILGFGFYLLKSS